MENKEKKYKTCSVCGFYGEESFFRKGRTTCLVCCAKKRKQYYKKNRDIILLKKKEYYQENKEEKKQYNVEYWQKNKEKLTEQNKQWRNNNKDKIKQHREKTKTNGKMAEYNKNSYQRNREKRIEQQKIYYQKHKAEINKKDAIAKRIRFKNNPLLRLKANIQREINHHINKKHRTSKYIEMFGWTVDMLREHLEKQFKNGMSWENYGKIWHLDHIKPQSWFDFSDEKQIIECWSLNNLQPLFAFDNISKGNRYAG